MQKETVLDILVSPKSSRSAIIVKDNTIKVYIKSPPINGKANKECIKLFSKRLKIPQKHISIIKGEKDKRKQLKIAGINHVEILNILKDNN